MAVKRRGPTRTQPDTSMEIRQYGALFSDCRLYRWTLWRHWDAPRGVAGAPPSLCAFVGLNPSTADEVQDDPTVRRCIRYAQQWGFSGMYMLNIFGFRATDPGVMRSQDDPVGVDNDHWIRTIVSRCDQTVFCWGNHGLHRERSQAVCRLLGRLRSRRRVMYSFGLTGQGEPKHPLYLRKDAPLIPFPFS